MMYKTCCLYEWMAVVEMIWFHVSNLSCLCIYLVYITNVLLFFLVDFLILCLHFFCMFYVSDLYHVSWLDCFVIIFFPYADENGNMTWQEVLKFMFDLASSQNPALIECALHMFS